MKALYYPRSSDDSLHESDMPKFEEIESSWEVNQEKIVGKRLKRPNDYGILSLVWRENVFADVEFYGYGFWSFIIGVLSLEKGNIGLMESAL
ncbi:hypothetical protein FQA39_LY04177 [Lamprigera yunnana]|nr:hypothetical protein FQA39_LY04177 [Lamprigera yunnana]